MTKLVLTLLSICISLILLGCFESETDMEGKFDWNKGSSFETSTVLSNKKTLSKTDTVWYDISVEKDTTYVVRHISDRDYEMGLIIILPDSIELESYRNSFKASADGICRIGIYVMHVNNDYPGPFEYTIDVKKHAPIPELFLGKWLLVNEIASAFGTKIELHSSLDDASSIIEIRNDSIIEYGYDLYGDSVYRYAGLFANSWICESKYTHSGNTISFSLGNDIGGMVEVYEKYDGSIAEIQWAKKNIKMPSELIGTWYLSSEIWREYEEENGIIENESGEEKYKLCSDSRKIYVIDSDSVTTYYRNRDWQFEVETSPIIDYYWLINNYEIRSGTLTVTDLETEVWTNIDGTEECEAWMEKETYESYMGELPPKEWTTITIPTSFSEIKLGESSSGTLHAGDSLWFRLPVSYGKDYHLTVTSASFDTFLAMVSEDKEVIGSNDDIGDGLLSKIEFTSEDNGFYYALLTGYSSSCSGDFKLSYATRTSRSKNDNYSHSQNPKEKMRKKRFKK